ncbi:Serum response factor [Araneus ventricosus]|uniref:Serum response factor homolog n=2 Tax=Araneus ventricosus TaxID=182803 RepID=A0A4Y2D987_ARAVE|nr:Serum response factor [Araneus ventricosus]
MQSSFSYRGRNVSFQHPKIEDSSEEDPMVLGMNSESYQTNGHDGDNYELNSREGSSSSGMSKKSLPANGKKTKGRVKIKMEFIDNKLRRYTTFSKRKTGIMKKAYELSTLTGTQVMLLVASETGHVYTFATRKLQPMITSEAGKALIQTCLNSPDLPPGPGASVHDQRMSATGFEETDLTYSVADDCEKMPDSPENVVYTSELSPSSMTSATTLLTPSLVSFASSLPTTSTSQRVVGGKPSFTTSSSSVTSPSNLAQTSSSIPSAGFTTILTAGGTKNQTASDSSSSQNSISLVQSSSANLSVVSGSVVLPPTILQTNNSAVLYHTGQGLVYATPANLQDGGVVLNLGQEQNGPQQQFITIPVSLSLTPAQQQLVQGVSSQSSTFTSASSSRREKTRK